MSRDLPARPNLEHLRKQAKELLRSLQRQKPESRLADAQHQIAREYGFESWPRLNAHVERRTTYAPNPLVGTWRRTYLDRDCTPSIGCNAPPSDSTLQVMS